MVSRLYKAFNVRKRRGFFRRGLLRTGFYLLVRGLITLNPYMSGDLLNLYVFSFYIYPEVKELIL